MVVRKGASKPDIGSVEALKRALLQAKSIAYSNNISGIYLSTELFPKLGIYSSIAGRGRKIEGEPVAAVVARGDAEIGFQQISELLPVPGVDFVGPLPPEVQRVSVFSAGIGAAASAADAARAFIRFLASADAAFAITKSGLEPITP
jgi:molybdate transport system substrate-binding protein